MTLKEMGFKVDKKKVGLDMAHLNPYQQKIMDKMKDLNLGQSIQLIWDLVENEFKHRQEEVFDGWKKYSKKHFTDYYNVNIRTFNKWLKTYCGSMNKIHSASKRKFYNKVEWTIIMNKLGWCDGFDYRSYKKIDLANALAQKDGVQEVTTKSIYNKYDKEINKYLFTEEKGLGIFPPVVAHRILQKILENDFTPFFRRSIDPPTDEYKANAMMGRIEKVLQQSDDERFIFGVKFTKAITKLFDGIKDEIEKIKINPDSLA